MSNNSDKSSATSCPIDDNARAAWLRQNNSNSSSPPPSNKPDTSPDPSCPVDHNSRSAWLQMNKSNPSPPSPPDASTILSQLPSPHPKLGSTREVSTIPRGESSPSQGSYPSNHEIESGIDKSGKWIYPSEKMFFDAMKRKEHDPRAEDMRAVVPIHNAVNERAWKEIIAWEKGQGAENRCGGPKLLSFSGMSTQLTPRARFNTLLGYQAPFDRHDWVIDRCGTRVEYVIDFYQGRNEGREGKPLNFYLDVRPKLNSWEGWKARVARTIGL
ncbi:cytochrome c and c1 heme-lyase [Eremomyces bilateralis CBS 781.70]|uniref:Holocytochrome c-type synthase n=1 Tax=Eremomyces bilateralis CBS 781.70 TaxID=1392243 RepID=A0A6G1G8T7_9PEZI|nr:cytochrome c and c1 heme-lyase [Eremomyces bilateralis CBS 781.70]KAF1814515.1 cytochrome c and c1 heme-lyase [Eremomyces bilateralis CBS 781.70]